MKFKRKKPAYRPNLINNKDIDKNIEELFAKQKKERVAQQQIPQTQPQQQITNIQNPLGAGNRSLNIQNPLGKNVAPLENNISVIDKQPKQMKFDAPNEWGVKPLNISQNQSLLRQQPQRQQQSTLDSFGMQMQQPQRFQQIQEPQQQETEETEEDPYWSAEEWEMWAYQIATNYPELQRFLPEWFMQALQE